MSRCPGTRRQPRQHKQGDLMNALIDDTVPIGRFAAKNPWSVIIFDRVGLDYCCHGDRSLADACRHAGVELSDVRDAIHARQQSSPEASDRCWDDASITELADHIETIHHVNTREAFARLSVL